ncbi:protein tincar-like [Artemia franciscana]|uniref:Protein tincar n=1 Tax=Artemia franciscana TaxID=6661 RepID=A0AA88HA01_ARTSF|nr:hypothetical protein QYM36_017939 [Artemia franciscana]
MDRKKEKCFKLHLNSAGSFWYGIFGFLLQAYVVFRCGRAFLKYSELDWLGGVPNTEVNTYVGLVGGAAVILPFFLVSAFLKVGNLANDGYQLGQDLSTCSTSPGILGQNGGVIGSLWRHGPPTSGMLHVVSAFACLLAKTIMDARMLRDGLLDRDRLWLTDLSPLVNVSSPSNNSDTYMGFIRPLSLEEFTTWPAPSIEFINFLISLIWFSVKAVHVYWAMSKPLGIIFSVHLIANIVHGVVCHCGIVILYRIHVMFTGSHPISGIRNEPFLLDSWTTLMLYVMTIVVVQGSQSILAMYGLQRLSAYVGQIRRKHLIRLALPRSSLWSYFPQIAASCVLLAMAACEGPLLYDLTKLYRSSKDLTILIAVGVMICHAFLWFSLWLVLSACRHWSFRLRVGVAKHALYSAPAVRLAVDLELAQAGQKPYAQGKTEFNPMVVLMRGRAVNVNDPEVQKMIMNLVERQKLRKVSPSQEQVYWPRSTRSPKESPVSEVPSLSKNKKHKVTFDDSVVESETRALLSPNEEWHRDVVAEDGEYALLRKLPLVTLPEEPEMKCDTPLVQSRNEGPITSTPVSHVEVHSQSTMAPPISKLCDITDSGCEDSASTGSPPSSTSNGSSGYVSRHSDVIDESAMKHSYSYTQPTVPITESYDLPPPPPHLYETSPTTQLPPPPVPPHQIIEESEDPATNAPPPIPPHGSGAAYNVQNQDNYQIARQSGENIYGVRNTEKQIYTQKLAKNFENPYGVRQISGVYDSQTNCNVRQENPYGQKQGFSYHIVDSSYSVQPQKSFYTKPLDSSSGRADIPPPVPKHGEHRVHIQGDLSVGVNHFQTFPHQRVTPAPVVRFNDTIAVSPRGSFYKNREPIHRGRKDVIPYNGLNAPALLENRLEQVPMKTFAPRK